MNSQLVDGYICPLDDYTILQVQGADAQSFLQGQLTCDVRLLNNADYAYPSAACNLKGRMVANFWIWQEGQDFYLLLPTSQITNLLNHLKKYAVFSKVELDPADDQKAFCIGGKILPSNTHCRQLRLPGEAPRALYVGTTKQLSSLQGQLSKTHHLGDASVFNLTNILTGFTLLTAELSALFTPQMIALEKFDGVSFDKGCYLGQEIIARTQHLGKLKRHTYRGLLAIAELPNIGSELRNAEQQAIGIITAASYYQDGKVIILAVIQDQAINQKIFYEKIPVDFSI